MSTFFGIKPDEIPVSTMFDPTHHTQKFKLFDANGLLRARFTTVEEAEAALKKINSATVDMLMNDIEHDTPVERDASVHVLQKETPMPKGTPKKKKRVVKAEKVTKKRRKKKK